MNIKGRYFVRAPDGGTIAGYDRLETAEPAALAMGEGSHVVDTQAPVYIPMIHQVVGGELQIMGVGGWGAERLTPEQNVVQAIKRKELAIVHAFIAMGAGPDTRDEKGRPAIIWAVASGRPEIVQYLLDAGANPASADPEGVTALDLATERGETEIMACIERVLNGRQSPKSL